MSRLLVGPRDQWLQVDSSMMEAYGGDVRRRSFYVRPAYRILDDGTEWDSFCARSYEALVLAAQVLPKKILNLWRIALDFESARRFYRLLRRARRWVFESVRDDKLWPKLVVVAIIMTIFYFWIVRAR